MPKISASPALSRLRILDLSRVRAGPTCVKQFADFGADVIKIESPPGVDPNEAMGGPREGPDMQNLHRNKRAMTLNLKLPEARDVLARLVKTADVVVENYRPDVKDRLGIDYKSLERINPRVILASISGFGQDGPYRDRPGFDQVAQGMSGLMSVTGLPGQGPVRTGAALPDERRSPAAGRQRPTDQHADLGLQDRRRLHQRRGCGARHVEAPVQRHRPRRPDRPRRIQGQRAARGAPCPPERDPQ